MSNTSTEKRFIVELYNRNSVEFDSIPVLATDEIDAQLKALELREESEYSIAHLFEGTDDEWTSWNK